MRDSRSYYGARQVFLFSAGLNELETRNAGVVPNAKGDADWFNEINDTRCRVFIHLPV